jgi:predicted nucleotidyltransferase
MNDTIIINYDRLIKTAEDIVHSIVKKHNSIIAAYSSGSFARRDMVYGSDFDIAFIASGYPASNKLPPEVTRKIFDDIIFEWAFAASEVFEVKSLLENHPSVCDLAIAKIWFDPDNFFRKVQDILRKEHARPDLIKLRAVNQLKIVENNFNEFKRSVKNGQFDNLLTQIFLIVRHAFNIPSVILNRPVTHCRSYLYCRNNSKDLGIEDFPDLVNRILGAEGFNAEKVNIALNTALKIFNTCGFPKESVETYKAHLRTVEYLLGINEPKAAVWPIYFEIVGAWHEAKRDNLADISEKIYESFMPVREEMRLVEKIEIEERVKIIGRVISSSKEMIDNYFKP